VTASQAIISIISARSAANTHPTICTRLRHGVGGANALGGPAPNSRAGWSGWGAGRGSLIGQVTLYYSVDTVKTVLPRDNLSLTTIVDSRKGK